MTAIAVRDAVAGAPAPLAQVHVASWRVTYRGMMDEALLDGLSVDGRAERWRERLAAGLTLVAVRAERIIGFCALRAQAEAPPYIAALYLHPDELRQGIGTRLLGEVLARLQAGGAREVQLSVLVENRGARAFYERHGFVALEERDEWHGGREVRMRLSLTSSEA